MKSKHSISAQKIYQSRIPLAQNTNVNIENNDSNSAIYFNIYDSDSIGIKANWDTHLKPQLCDNDTDTPQLIIDLANKDNMHYLGEGINEFTFNKNSVYNYPSK